MGRYLVRRVGFSITVILVASLFIYGSLDLAGGSPLTALTGGRPVDQQTRAKLTRQNHLDDPFVVRYVDWMKDVAHGDLGRSYVEGDSVSTLIRARAGTTALLVVLSSLIIIAGGVGVGLVAALKKGKIGLALTVAAGIGLGVPTFVASMLLLTVFAVDFGWFPVFGSGSGALDQLWHLTLPAIALALATAAYIARITQASVDGELRSEHVMTATARGLPRGQVIRRHVLRNAAIPITTASGLIVAYLVVGAAVVESSFSLNGLGSFLVTSVSRSDFPVVQAIALIVIVTFVVTNFVVDVIVALLDPRVGLK